MTALQSVFEAVRFVATTEGLLLASTVSFCISYAGYRLERPDLGRGGAIVGFVALFFLFAALAVTYVLDRRWDLIHYFLAAVGGVAFCVRSVSLLLDRWTRSKQLVTMCTAMVVVLLPFQLAPTAMASFQEAWAVHLVGLFERLGFQPSLGTSPNGELTRITFDNSAFIYIVRECTGIDAVALFGGIIAAARTSLARKLGAAAFLVGAVYAVNLTRLLFVGSAIAGNWFGPYLTDGNTVMASYYVAEVFFGQVLVVAASVGGVLLVGRWIPDAVAFAGEVLGVVDRQRGNEP